MTKQEANEDLRNLAIAYAAFAAIHSKKGASAYDKLARSLKSIANAIPIEKQDVKVNRRSVVGSLLKMGALLKKN